LSGQEYCTKPKGNIVIIIGEMIMPSGNAAAQRTGSLTSALVELGYKVVIIGLNKNMNNDIDILHTFHQYDNYECYECHYPGSIKQWLNRMVTIKPFVKVMKHYGLDQIYGIIAQEHEAFSLLRLAHFCKENKIPICADNIEWYERSKLRFPINLGKNMDTWVRMNMIYPRIKNMICISRYLSSYYMSAKKNIVYIPCTTNAKDKKWKAIQPYVVNEVPTIGYTGHPGIEFQKERLDWVVQSICSLNTKGKPCRLKIAGITQDEFKLYAPGLISLPYFNERVSFLGNITHTKCLELIRSVDYTIIARESKRVTNAGFPTKLAESFACGTPVISSPTSNIAEYIIPYKTGFVSENCTYEEILQTIEIAIGQGQIEIYQMHEYTEAENSLDIKIYTESLGNFMSHICN